MTAPDLHPEDLLDRDATGALSEHERAHLDAHLAVCVTCRFERQARLDFAALPVPSLAVDALVTRALAGTATHAAPARRRFSPGVIAVAVTLVGAVSFGAMGLARPIAVFLGIAPAVEPAVPLKSPTRQPPPRLEPRVEPPSPPPLEVHPTPPVPAPVPIKPRTKVVTTVIETPVVPSAPPSAAELFRAATSARTEGRVAEAEALYRQLTVQFPGSAEAVTAHAVLGRLLIDLGRPTEALRELEATLSAVDAGMREDALAHRALAFDALHDVVRARAAWQLLLREFPTSIHARRAKERLEDLTDL